MTETVTVTQLAAELKALRERVEDLEDLRDFDAAVRENGDKPLIPWETAKQGIVAPWPGSEIEQETMRLTEQFREIEQETMQVLVERKRTLVERKLAAVSMQEQAFLEESIRNIESLLERLAGN